MLKFDFLRFYIIFFKVLYHFVDFFKKYGKIFSIFLYSKFSFILGDGLFMKKITKITLIFASLFAVLTLSVAAEEAGAANVAVVANPQEQNVQQNKNEAQAAQNQVAEQAVANNAAANANPPVQNQNEAQAVNANQPEQNAQNQNKKVYKAIYELQTSKGEAFLMVSSACLANRIVKVKKDVDGCSVTQGVGDNNLLTISSVAPASTENAQKELNAADEMEKTKKLFEQFYNDAKAMKITDEEFNQAKEQALENAALITGKEVDPENKMPEEERKKEVEKRIVALKDSIKKLSKEQFFESAPDLQFKINGAVEDKK